MIKHVVNNGENKFTIDAGKAQFPKGFTLPSGDYEVTVKFYPNWRDNRETAKSEEIKALSSSSVVSLKGSGGNPEELTAFLKNYNWVFANVSIGDAWEPAFWEEKFGGFEDVGYQGSLNPRMIKAYYLTSYDITLIVNSMKNTIAGL